MKCNICFKEMAPGETVEWVLHGGGDYEIVRYLCNNCASDLENQVRLLQTFHKNESEVKSE